ncbi:RNA exonuclease [Blastomyces dermatitidis ATCC 18188]|uniref:RNA exonuclease n=1 Tax=Ajellomyces dermatitidis (strain ATCC 18188 / CBS 674.68) TaxID=653446 RepID=F2TAN3_AJEDA|nr:RNA exonuclease [Blastomyces dermatitidis ATCC 18188]
MNASNFDTRNRGGSLAGQERTMQSSSSTSERIKTRNRAQRRSFKKGKNNNAVRDNNTSIAPTNSPASVQYPPDISSPAQRTGDWNWSRPSNALSSIDQVQGRLRRELMDLHFPPLVPIPVEVHAASVPLARRTVERPKQPPASLLAPEQAPKQAHDMTYRRDDGSSLAVSETATAELAQELGPSNIEATPEYMLHLNALIAKPRTLKEAGYVLNPLSTKDFEQKKRCRGCGTTMAKVMRPRERAVQKREKSKDHPIKSDYNASEKKDSSQKEKGDVKCEDDETKTTPKKKIIPCKFHPGPPVWNRQGKIWSCCRQPMSADPCSGAEQHIARYYLPGEIQRLWQFHPTPRTPNMSSPDTRAAVAIDCEMGQAASGDSELIRVTLIDYFSSAVLIDSLVYPTVKMEHYRTRFSGVSRRDMETAMKEGSCIMGRDMARFTVWRYVGPQTVVVGHSAHNDLESLRWIHSKVIDTHIIESLLEKEKKCESKKEGDKPEEDGKETAEKDEATPLTEESGGNEHEAEHQLDEDEESNANTSSKGPKKSPNSGARPDESAPDKGKQGPPKKRNKGSGKLSLKTLARERLGRDIQNAGNKGHDSLEDALAARDLVHWHIVNRGRVGLDDG